MNYNVTIESSSPCALFDLKGSESDLISLMQEFQVSFPKKPNTSSRSDELEIYWIGPSHWLLRAPLDKENELLTMFDAQAIPDTVSIIRVSDTLTFFKISGTDANQIMSIASPLDTHDAVFPSGSVTYTEAFGIKALAIRHEQSFELAVDRSFSEMIGDHLERTVGENVNRPPATRHGIYE